MRRTKSLIFTFVFLLFISQQSGLAQNWPGWRGPNGDGTSLETNLPTKWDSVTNVIWKSSVPGEGFSSPIIWKDRLFITAAFQETQEKALLCYDCTNGKLLWQKTVVKGPFEGKHPNNGYASGTPVTDGALVFVSFLDGQEATLAAYDFSGKQVWLKHPGNFISRHGFSCSPVLFEDKVIINGESQQGESFVAALRKTDGEIIWKINHEKKAHDFSTPIFIKVEGKVQMIFCGNKEIASYNPVDGSKYWFVTGPSEEFCSTPVYNEKSGLVLVSSSYPIRILMAVRPTGQGDVTSTHVAWQSSKSGYYVPSPISTPDYLYASLTTGNVNCLDIATGNILWTESLGTQYSSAVMANGLVYMPNDEGVITVIKPGPKFEFISKNSIGERMYASPAISNGRIYLRGFQNIYCIGSPGSK